MNCRHINELSYTDAKGIKHSPTAKYDDRGHCICNANECMLNQNSRSICSLKSRTGTENDHRFLLDRA